MSVKHGLRYAAEPAGEWIGAVQGGALRDISCFLLFTSISYTLVFLYEHRSKRLCPQPILEI